MGLQFYDSNQDPVAKGIFSINGRWGGLQEQLFFIRNDDPGRYYSNVSVVVLGSVYDALSEFGSSGWSVKLLYGQRRPTEAEWDLIRSGEALELPDIGTTSAADTSTYHPIWVRAYCPAHEQATIVETYSLELRFVSHVVGA